VSHCGNHQVETLPVPPLGPAFGSAFDKQYPTVAGLSSCQRAHRSIELIAEDPDRFGW